MRNKLNKKKQAEKLLKMYRDNGWDKMGGDKDKNDFDGLIKMAVDRFDEEIFDNGDKLYEGDHDLPYITYPFILHHQFYNSTDEDSDFAEQKKLEEEFFVKFNQTAQNSTAPPPPPKKELTEKDIFKVDDKLKELPEEEERIPDEELEEEDKEKEGDEGDEGDEGEGEKGDKKTKKKKKKKMTNYRPFKIYPELVMFDDRYNITSVSQNVVLPPLYKNPGKFFGKGNMMLLEQRIWVENFGFDIGKELFYQNLYHERCYYHLESYIDYYPTI